jgi:hypothetical protein
MLYRQGFPEANLCVSGRPDLTGGASDSPAGVCYGKHAKLYRPDEVGTNTLIPIAL